MPCFARAAASSFWPPALNAGLSWGLPRDFVASAERRRLRLPKEPYRLLAATLITTRRIPALYPRSRKSRAKANAVN